MLFIIIFGNTLKLTIKNVQKLKRVRMDDNLCKPGVNNVDSALASLQQLYCPAPGVTVAAAVPSPRVHCSHYTAHHLGFTVAAALPQPGLHCGYLTFLDVDS